LAAQVGTVAHPCESPANEVGTLILRAAFPLHFPEGPTMTLDEAIEEYLRRRRLLRLRALQFQSEDGLSYPEAMIAALLARTSRDPPGGSP
jgi:hypothetical protein